jgi:hypothetical protein
VTLRFEIDLSDQLLVRLHRETVIRGAIEGFRSSRMQFFDGLPQARLVLGVVGDADFGLLGQLGTYWQNRYDCRGAIPVRDDVDPGAISKLLRNLWLIERCASPPHWRIRLAGSAIYDALGLETTGLRLDTFPFLDFGAHLAACCDGSMAVGGPFRCRFGPFAQAFEPNMVAFCEHLAVPLAACARYPQTAMVASVFFVAATHETP